MSFKTTRLLAALVLASLLGGRASAALLFESGFTSDDGGMTVDSDSVEGPWNNGIFGFGHSVPHKRGYFPVAPFDTLQDLRSEMVRELIDAGVPIELHHHEVGTAGQCEIDMHYDTMVKMADNVQLYKYIVKNVAQRHGKTVTFMPKPIYGDNGSGMHCHQSLWADGKPLFPILLQADLVIGVGLVATLCGVLAAAAPARRRSMSSSTFTRLPLPTRFNNSGWRRRRR